MKISLLTNTGGRPEAFALCEKWIARQTFKDWFEWIVVDDCEPRTVCTLGQRVLYPDWIWAPGKNTQAETLSFALPHIRGDAVIIIEDDDYYGARHLERMVEALDSFDLVGEEPGHFYNVATLEYANRPSALRIPGLCSFAFKRKALSILDRVCWIKRGGLGEIDLKFWELWLPHRGTKTLLGGELQVRGIKGLPGRPGITIAHQLQGGGRPRDLDGSVFSSWLGPDVESYALFWGSAAPDKKRPVWERSAGGNSGKEKAAPPRLSGRNNRV